MKRRLKRHSKQRWDKFKEGDGLTSQIGEPPYKKRKLNPTDHVLWQLNCNNEATSPTESNISTASLPYAGLPPEIWCRIYELVIETEEFISVEYKFINFPIDNSSLIIPQARRLPDSRTLLALASTCRRMYSVAAPIYHGKNTFRIGPSTDKESFFSTIGRANLDIITSIRFSDGKVREYIPWHAISAMANIKNIAVLYPKVILKSRLKSSAVLHHNQFIKALSQLSDEQPGETTWTTKRCPWLENYVRMKPEPEKVLRSGRTL